MNSIVCLCAGWSDRISPRELEEWSRQVGMKSGEFTATFNTETRQTNFIFTHDEHATLFKLRFRT